LGRLPAPEIRKMESVKMAQVELKTAGLMTWQKHYCAADA
jgi:hypothetical protein